MKTFLMTVARAALVLGSLTAAAACNDSDASSSDGSEPEPPPPQLPPPPQISCIDKMSLANACNYKIVYEQNLAAGYTPIAPNEDFAATQRTIFEPFQPTEACKAQLETLVTFGPTWNLTYSYFHDMAQELFPDEPEVWTEYATGWLEKRKRAKHNFLSAMHALFFHPVLATQDQKLILGFFQNVEGWTEQYGIRTLPPAGSFVLDETYINEKILDRFVSEVTSILLDDESYKMATYGSTIFVSEDFAAGPYKDNTFYASESNVGLLKYPIARTLFHEFMHATGISNDHAICPVPGDEDNECDQEIDSAYGLGSAFEHALHLGALYSRLPGQSAYLVPDIDLLHMYKANCTAFVDNVVAVNDWVGSEGNWEFETCAGGEYMSHLTDTRLPAANLDLEAGNPNGFECLVGAPFEPAVNLAAASNHVSVSIPGALFHWASRRSDALLSDVRATATHVASGTATGTTSRFAYKIDWIHQDSVAAKLGLRAGDAIVAVNGVSVQDLAAVIDFYAELPRTRAATLTVVRRGVETTIDYAVAD